MEDLKKDVSQSLILSVVQFVELPEKKKDSGICHFVALGEWKFCSL
jgi:hypothetical protein